LSTSYPGKNIPRNWTSDRSKELLRGDRTEAEIAISAATKTIGLRDAPEVNARSAAPHLGATTKRSAAMQSKTSNTQTNHADPAGHCPNDVH
jgi:hypothetical protein